MMVEGGKKPQEGEVEMQKMWQHLEVLPAKVIMVKQQCPRGHLQAASSLHSLEAMEKGRGGKSI